VLVIGRKLNRRRLGLELEIFISEILGLHCHSLIFAKNVDKT
jgi:hypothetical protein